MADSLDQFYLTQVEPNQGCLLALREIILRQDDSITESLKYGCPCFSYKGRMFCYLWIEKKTNLPYILMVEGAKLDHPALDQGDRKRMKILRIDPNQDIPLDLVEKILNMGLDLYRNGQIRIKGKN